MNGWFWFLFFLGTGALVSPHMNTLYGTMPVLYGSFLWLHLFLGLGTVHSLFVPVQKIVYLGFVTFVIQIVCQLIGFYDQVETSFCIPEMRKF